MSLCFKCPLGCSSWWHKNFNFLWCPLAIIVNFNTFWKVCHYNSFFFLFSPLCWFVKLWVLGCKLHVGIVEEHFEILIYDEFSNFFWRYDNVDWSFRIPLSVSIYCLQYNVHLGPESPLDERFQYLAHYLKLRVLQMYLKITWDTSTWQLLLLQLKRY